VSRRHERCRIGERVRDHRYALVERHRGEFIDTSTVGNEADTKSHSLVWHSTVASRHNHSNGYPNRSSLTTQTWRRTKLPFRDAAAIRVSAANARTELRRGTPSAPRLSNAARAAPIGRYGAARRRAVALSVRTVTSGSICCRAGSTMGW
jgi:hypothetical protein